MSKNFLNLFNSIDTEHMINDHEPTRTTGMQHQSSIISADRGMHSRNQAGRFSARLDSCSPARRGYGALSGSCSA